jgi:phosphogluconate dehydratase
MGRAVIKTAAVSEDNLIIEAPAIVFNSQKELFNAFKKNELNKDFIAVLPFQGPKHNGMPELHKLTPYLTILQKKGHKVGLVTDGRMSGASGQVPAAIHLTPEAMVGGIIGKIKTGDKLKLDAQNGTLKALEFDEISKREPQQVEAKNNTSLGRSLFQNARKLVGSSEEGASFIL